MPGVFQGLPADLQDQPLLGIQARGFAGGYAEEFGIESIHAVEKSAGPRVHFPGRFRIGIKVGLDVPAIGRDFPDGIAPARQKTPKRFGGIRSSWKPAAHSDDGDRFGLGPLQFKVPALHVLERVEGFVQQKPAFGRFGHVGHCQAPFTLHLIARGRPAF